MLLECFEQLLPPALKIRAVVRINQPSAAMTKIEQAPTVTLLKLERHYIVARLAHADRPYQDQFLARKIIRHVSPQHTLAITRILEEPPGAPD